MSALVIPGVGSGPLFTPTVVLSSKRKIYNNQTRNWPLLASWLPNWGSPYITGSYRIEAFRGVPLILPPLCREASVSRTAGVSFSQSGPTRPRPIKERPDSNKTSSTTVVKHFFSVIQPPRQDCGYLVRPEISRNLYKKYSLISQRSKNKKTIVQHHRWLS